MNRFKHAKWWRSYLDKLKQGFWTFTGLNFKWKHEHKQREAKRKSKQSEEKQRGQQLQSSFALLEYIPKSIFYILYTISKLWKSRIQRFKPCTIWSWNEKDMAFGSQLLQVVRKFRTTQGVMRNSHNTFKIRITHACCEFSSAFADSTLDIFLCILWCNFLSYPCN